MSTAPPTSSIERDAAVVVRPRPPRPSARATVCLRQHWSEAAMASTMSLGPHRVTEGVQS